MIIYRFENKFGEGIYQDCGVVTAYHMEGEEFDEPNPMDLTRPSEDRTPPMWQLYCNVLGRTSGSWWFFGFQNMNDHREHFGPRTVRSMMEIGVVQIEYAIHEDYVRVGCDQVAFLKCMATELNRWERY